ncbi:MAG: trypsin-like peptidase domain-containing protein [Cyanobacteria bacterium P01_F01_bin.143]
MELQNHLRQFTVQVRRIGTEIIVGTGFVVSDTGQIVTCVHVVKKANQTREIAEGIEVDIYFPQTIKEEDKSHKAYVSCFFQNYNDDVVILQLDQEFLPDKVEVAILGTANKSADNRFRSFGYRRLVNYQGLPANGDIIGTAERPKDRKLQADPVMLNSQNIDSGMSGAAVLDIKRDLVIGVIAETWDSKGRLKDRDTSFAVDSLVLTFNPMCLPVHDVPPPQQTELQPESDIEENLTAVSQPETKFNNEPPPLKEWVGRKEFLQNLDQDWQDSERLITGLIGFGGEGKSSLTRRWLDDLLDNSSLPQPKGVFWWGFYENTNVDQFFEALLKFMSDGQINPSTFSSTQMKAKVITSFLGSGRYLLVLDGLEVLQHQNGDDYGLLKNIDLRDWLRDFAAGGHKSFCMISSRAPLLDLIDFTTYTHRDVERLSINEGRDLLRKIKVKGTDAQLEQVVQEWDGYALVLSLLGSYLVDRFEGKIEHLKDIPVPTADEPKYDRVRRVLRRYDEHLTEEEGEFLEIFSAFRLPVPEAALEPVFGQDSSQESPIVKQLIKYRILRHNTQAKHYTTHPLIRAHYLECLQSKPSFAQPVHRKIADYYLNSAGETPDHPTLDDLKPLIETVHHLCQAGDYDEALNSIVWERIDQGNRAVSINVLGAYETNLSVMQSFFPNSDTSQEPQISNPENKSFIINAVGFCLMNLGHMNKAVPFYERAITIHISIENWKNASIGYQNLADLYVDLGKLNSSVEAASEALKLIHLADHKWGEQISLSKQAWAAHLQGDLETASSAFQDAEVLEREIDPDKHYLYSLRGIQHADHLRRIGNADYARKVTEVNLEICQRNSLIKSISQCYRVLGDLDAHADNHYSAQSHYQEALKIARSISLQFVLIEVLLAQGRWLAKQGEVAAARRDLDEALNYAVAGGYRIYEADSRVGLAWAHLADDNHSAAQKEAEKALRMSEEMGYYWGQVDAKEVLERLETLD